MLEKIGVYLFVTLCLIIMYAHSKSEVVVYECNKPKKTPYFVGTLNNYKVLKGRVKYIKEKECTTQKMTRGEWYMMKSAFKNTKGIQ
tara:strand:+ start:403 stop:663 length:261 start_codon:yes stop_codon:yes gene_type:complete